ncbi:Phospholipase A1 [Zhongshania aliphaticivorans]|uniref:Phospholipase A1 n=1 Tax=Zhongshania aliphaticivorans TaxID=1470434 RepID=A0A5S9PX04_9GAMM|nr:phospholipase A [Zhongshania aliphaticivorans]CAA0109656.1 Phospholipase A1 [Zhongshania aliphaticivorans]CAA0117817.1 Phospholipase A1 [Zhongshania aliphaticivorans]CAA0121552.1 Phospholipase A1 [Zhongshania aliphaticivorans]
MQNCTLLAALLILLVNYSHAQTTSDDAECLQLAAQSATESTTLGELRSYCAEMVKKSNPNPSEVDTKNSEQSGVVEQRYNLEQFTTNNPFVLTPHRTNYVLPVSYRDDISDYSGILPNNSAEADSIELEFQLSIKLTLWEKILNDNGYLSVGYTNRSFWQAYNKAASAPFRETNHEPELMLTFTNSWELFGIRNVANQLIFNHQSNGRSEPLSRSWNRIMLNMVFERDRFAMSFKPWYRLPESSDDDDNPDIEKYLGHFEWMGLYKWHDRTLSIMLRNNLRSENKGALELGWSFPISTRVKAYVKYFNGYGESLIEYNNAIESIGIGVLISDWL